MAKNWNRAVEITKGDANERCLAIVWGDGHQSRFPYPWLRHLMSFPANPGSDPDDESLTPPDNPDDLAISELHLEGEHLVIDWAGGKGITRHRLEWLRRHCPSPAARRERKHQPIAWDAATAAALPWFDWPEVAGDETRRLDFMLAILDYGFARLRGVPTEPGSIEDVARYLGPVHETNYGRIFDVRTDSSFKIGATSARYLGPHSDENYRHAPPGISLFHCLSPSPNGGGRSLLVDGFMAAERLRRTDPQAFETLIQVPARFVSSSPVEDIRATGRIITVDIDGDIVGIRYTDRTMTEPDLPEALIEPFYRAVHAFTLELYRPTLILDHPLAAGELQVFDNQRILHGRTAFDPSAGTRHLQQCAVDRDEFHQSLRLLARAQGHPAADKTFAGGALG